MARNYNRSDDPAAPRFPAPADRRCSQSCGGSWRPALLAGCVGPGAGSAAGAVGPPAAAVPARASAVPSRSSSIRASRNCCRRIRTTTQINVTSDTGELGRAATPNPERQRDDPHGPAPAHRGPGQHQFDQRSVRLNGDVEYLDPQLHVRGKGGSFAEGGGGTFEGAEFELPDRVGARRGDERQSQRGRAHRTRGRALHGLPAWQRRLEPSAPARSTSTRKT